MAKTELERLVVVETKLDALLQAHAEITVKIDALLANYVHRAEYEKELDAIRIEIERTKARSVFQSWVTGTLSAILGAVIAILIKSYFE